MQATSKGPDYGRGLFALLACAILAHAAASRSCTVPSPVFLQEPAKPRAAPTRPAYLTYPLPRPVKVKRDSAGRVVHLNTAKP